MLRAIWGIERKLRCLGIVLGIVNDSLRTDPLAAIVFRRLSDARRIMRKSKERQKKAIEVFSKVKTTPNPMYPKIQGQGHYDAAKTKDGREPKRRGRTAATLRSLRTQT